MKNLKKKFEGEFYYDHTSLHQLQLLIYSTDASVYQEKPCAVALPKSIEDIKKLINLATLYKITLIPRAAGTSLAGQVVGNGIVVDISKYFNQVLEINTEEKWVRVQPGVIRDDLNSYLKPYGLFFGPETSTANRAMVGGMVGNNSCGLHSIVWGDTRSHLLEAKVILSDGSEAIFKDLTIHEYEDILSTDDTEGRLYKELHNLLYKENILNLIEKKYPVKTLKRRNTGYALDILTDNEIFKINSKNKFNLCSLLAGSEGTLAFITEVKLNLLPLPPKATALLCIHCKNIQESLSANIIALKYAPMASELVDKYILDFTKGHTTYEQTRFFIEGDPEAILMVEFMADEETAINEKIDNLIQELKERNLGYAYPVLTGEKINSAWNVRKAGLGLLRNIKGDTQPVNLIEDCAVDPNDLPQYIEDLQKMLDKYGVKAAYYAHAGAGELHVEPLLNLKSKDERKLFRTILEETSKLVIKYNGSLSGEHGDGRLRGEFIPHVLGNEVYELCKKVKTIFDPNYIFNRGKIIDTPPMDSSLRYDINHLKPDIKTYFDFSKQESIIRLAEKCSGSGDCRKTEITGGTMCPSFMATRNEKDSTRARANTLRQFLSNTADPNPFNHEEIKDVMDLCLSCKGCKSECPSSVDVGKMKAEFLQHYYDQNGIPLRSKLIGRYTKSQALASAFPSLYNFIITNKFTSSVVKKILGFADERPLPKLSQTTLLKWYKARNRNKVDTHKKVYFFVDEFINYNDVEIGQKAIMLLEKLGYEVIPIAGESGRTYLSKGMVKDAKILADKNVALFNKLSEDTLIIGIEPSAILTFRDEYPDLVSVDLKEQANELSKRCFLIDEFISHEIEKGMINSSLFTHEEKTIYLHGHCHQKALSSIEHTVRMLSLAKNYKVKIIPSGCCGMAGSFGYEKEHYKISMQIGELVLFPYVRELNKDAIIAANGTSCRHQIKDGTSKLAYHPIEILYDALN